LDNADKDSAEVKWKEYQTELPFEVAWKHLISSSLITS
jgi:hypothetical protein